MSTFITGSVAYDNIMDFPGHFKDHILPEKIHMLNISFLVDSLKRQRGGVAANIAYTMALLGDPPALFASVGAKDWAEYEAWLHSHGVDTRYVEVVPDEFTATCYITTDLDNNQITGFYTGAMANDKSRSLTSVPRDELGLVVIGPTEPEPIVRFTRECQEMGVPYIYSPIWQIIRMSGEDLAAGVQGAKVVVANDYEYELIKDKTGMDQHKILDFADMVVTTRGKHGSVIMTRDEVAAIPPATPRQVVDPVGAGDAYLGGLVYALNAGMDIHRAGRVAALAAVYAIEQYGTQAHAYTREEFAQRYIETFGDEPHVMEAMSSTRSGANGG
jgi:adenosine kinase